jgi:threonine dehydratase
LNRRPALKQAEEVAEALAAGNDVELVGIRDIKDAARRLEGVVRATPTASSGTLSKLAGRPVLVKPEHLQRTGSFKIRGAYNKVAAVAAEGSATQVVAASAGNHAQGVALAASLSGLRSTVFMPSGASLPKVEATRAYGAEVRFCEGGADEAIREAGQYAAKVGACYVHPFDDRLVIAGQGTIGMEVAAEAPADATVVVPVGGGGLVSGIAAALRGLGGKMQLVGVEAAGAAPMAASLVAKQAVELPRVETMADGIAVRCVSPLTFEHTRRLVDRVVTVDEEQISQAVLILLERCKWVVEPAGATPLSALLAGAVPGDGPVVLVLSGGNVDPLLLTRLIEHGLTAAGRYLTLRVVLPDKPGALAALTAALSQLGLNLLTVEHRRGGAQVGVNEVEVVVTLETRDPAHRDQVAPALRAQGFRAEAYPT